MKTFVLIFLVCLQMAIAEDEMSTWRKNAQAVLTKLNNERSKAIRAYRSKDYSGTKEQREKDYNKIVDMLIPIEEAEKEVERAHLGEAVMRRLKKVESNLTSVDNGTKENLKILNDEIEYIDESIDRLREFIQYINERKDNLTNVKNYIESVTGNLFWEPNADWRLIEALDGLLNRTNVERVLGDTIANDDGNVKLIEMLEGEDGIDILGQILNSTDIHIDNLKDILEWDGIQNVDWSRYLNLDWDTDENLEAIVNREQTYDDYLVDYVEKTKEIRKAIDAFQSYTREIKDEFRHSIPTTVRMRYYVSKSSNDFVNTRKQMAAI